MLNLGTLEFVLGINTRALDAAVKRVENFGKTVEMQQLRANRGLENNVSQFRRVENSILKAGEMLNKLTNQIERSNLTPDLKTAMIADANRAYNELTKQIALTGKAADSTKLDRGFAQYINKVNQATFDLRELSDAQKDAAAEAAKLTKAQAKESAKAEYARFNEVLGQTAVRWKSAAKSARESADVFKKALTEQEKLGKIKLDQTALANQARFNQLLGITTEKVKSAKASADVFKAAFENTGKVEASFARQERKLASMVEQARNLASSIELSALGDKPKLRLADAVQDEINRMRALMTGPTPLNPAEFQKASLQYTAKLGEIRREFGRLKADANTGDMGAAQLKRMRDTLANLGSTMLLINGHLGGMSTRFIALSTITSRLGIAVGLTAGALAGLGIALTTVGRGALQTELKLEKARLALTAVTGSAIIAESQFKRVREISNQAGLAFDGLARSYSKYLAAGIASGQAVAETERQFKSIALASGTLGLTVEDTEGVFRAFEQMLSKGTVQAEELRGQLGDRFPGAFAIAAQAMGVTTAELNKMMKAGEVLSAEFIPKFVDAMKVAYNIDDGKNIDTLQAAINRATNSVTYFFDAFNRSTGVVNLAIAALKVFERALTFVSDNMETLVRTTVALTSGLVAGTAAWFAWGAAAVIVSKVTVMVNAVTVAIAAAGSVTRAWAAAIAAVNVLMTNAPWGKILGVIARLAFVIGTAVFGYQKMEEWINNTTDAFSGSLGTIEAYIERQRALGVQTRSTTEELIRQARVLAAQASQKALDASFNAMEDARELARIQERMNKNPAAFRKGSTPATQLELMRKRSQESTQEMLRLNMHAMRAASAVAALEGEISQLPELGGGVSTFTNAMEDAGGATGSAADKAKQAADSVAGLTDEYRKMVSVVQAIQGGEEAMDMAEALHEARNAVEGLEPDALVLLDKALAEAGFTTGTLVERLAVLNRTTDSLSEKAGDFRDAWGDVESVVKDLSLSMAKLEHFQKTGSDDFRGVENLAKTAEMISNLNDEGIQSLSSRLIQLGVDFEVADTPAKSLLATLMKIYSTIDANDDKIELGKAIADEIASLDTQAFETQKRIQGLQQGLRGNELDVWVERAVATRDWAQALRAAGIEGAEFDNVMRNLAVAYEGVRRASVAEEEAEKWADFQDEAAQAVGAFAKAAILDFNNIGNSVKNLINTLLDLIIEMLIIQPLVESLKGGIGGGGFLSFLGLKDGGYVNFASGGYVRGPGTTTSDSVPARLSSGEFVFNAAAVQRYGVSTLQAMNDGRVFAGSQPTGADGSDEIPITLTLKVLASELFEVKMAETADQRIGEAAPKIVSASVAAQRKTSSRRTITGR